MEEYFFQMEDTKIPIYLTDGLQEIADKITENGCNRVILVYDRALDDKLVDELGTIINKRVLCSKIGVSIDENTKNLDMVKRIIENILEYKANRKTIIVAIGGGVVGNVVGMVAGLAFRGIPLVHIPTTIVAATDSILSLKQAVNTKYGKNLAGLYYCPNAVLMSNIFFKTLPMREYHAGLAETVKNLLAIIPVEIPNFMNRIKELSYSFEDLKYIFEISLEAKQKVLINDKYEKKSGLVLEYGHTIGHAIEVVTEGKVRHGEAISFGMLVAAEISNEFGFLNNEEVEMHYELLKMIDVYKMFYLFKNCAMEEVINIMRYDNKRTKIENNKISLVLLKKLGECYSNDYASLLEIDEELIFDKMNYVMRKLSKYIN